jgi:hypothetical protein
LEKINNNKILNKNKKHLLPLQDIITIELFNDLLNMDKE